MVYWTSWHQFAAEFFDNAQWYGFAVFQGSGEV